MAVDDEAARLARALQLLHDTSLRRDGRARLSDLDATLDELAFGDADRRAILASRARLGVYRALVRNNFGTTVFRLLPRTRTLVNQHFDDAFDDDFVVFLEAPGPRSSLLRDVIFEAADALDRAWAAREAMAAEWPRELLALERARFAADVALGPAPAEAVPTVDAGLRLGAAAGATLFAFTHDVASALLADDDDLTVPAKTPSHVAVSRDAADEVHITPIDESTFSVASSLMAGRTLGEAVIAANVAHDPRVASGLAALAAAGFFAAS